ncbi:glycyl-tRNA synthetase [Methanosarcinales archaeon]|nr:glycine--tRNA ligase [Candidatus Methanoperedens sp. BLZ2]KAB2944701.1 MAG: glycine--tRNA ligase [Candidatus Methanoperedens sp.]MBZ0175872.1 glycine--tRNA ligase [Candidatus Methanoperedens nitroreducens]CAG0950081.1 glycyl-tRNA synthetase [Methanosarcinales archaeon]MCX9076384.1 glycine--tRNA ligase [Candidatus Methanoperedens sp.]MCX9086581.1 glycine--tRNA ligase [Candidatus Methanoperedens sp.]
MADKYEQVLELAKRRGFLWNSFELYGGTAGFFDYGPLGAMLKRRVENIWRDIFVINEGYYEIEAPTIGIEDIFIASGHVGGFSDPLTECQKCHEDFRADHLVKDIIENPDTLSSEELTDIIGKNNVRCPECGGKLGNVYEFNLMFKTAIGPGGKRIGYLRPETAQGMFVDFPRLVKFYRDHLPFGATQIGKAYRNEISPRQGVIRLREFTQAEAEIFIDPRDKTHPKFKEVADLAMNLYSQNGQVSGETTKMSLGDAVKNGIIAHEFLAYCLAMTYQFLVRVGVSPEKLRFRQHMKDEMAHYAADCWDAEILSDRFGWVEVVGIADRTDFDLKAHAKQSEKELSVYVSYDTPRKVQKFVVKPDMGVLGPMFKGKAGKVANALKALRPEELSGDVIEVTVDGEKIKIDKKSVKFETVTEEIHGENIIPHVIEPSFGIDRITYSLLEHSYFEEETKEKADDEEEENEGKRIVLRLPPEVAPVQAAVLPLLSRDELRKPGNEIVGKLRKAGILVAFDDSGTIGRRYRRNDEIGTPYSITVDYRTLEDDTVTIRDRDTMKQVRAPVSDIEKNVYDLIYRGKSFDDAGKGI